MEIIWNRAQETDFLENEFYKIANITCLACFLSSYELPGHVKSRKRDV